MQLTMEPLEEILEHARVMDEAGFDTIWLAEAYPWWRKHSMEARSSTALSPLVARETERLAVGWGIISPYTRHPIQIAMEARVTQEAAGPGRFYLGLGVSKIFMRHAGDRRGLEAGGGDEGGGARSSAACSAATALDFDGQGLLGARAGARGRRRGAALGRAALLRRHRPDDAEGRGAGRRRPADRLDHDARVRPLRARASWRRPAAIPTRSTSAARSSPRSTRTASAAATARARSPACTSRTRCRTSRRPPTRCSSAPA